MMEKHKKNRFKRLATNAAITAAALTTPALWADRYTNHLRVFPGKDDNVSDTHLPSTAEDSALNENFKTRFVDVVAGYNARDGHPDLTAEEIAFAKDRVAQYELLDESRTDNGFYGALFRDKQTGKLILNIAGMNLNGLGKTWKGTDAFASDFDDVLFATSGGETDQLDDAIAFAKRAQARYGRIDYLTAHSLGAYLATFLQGMNSCPDAECFLYDSPGVTKTMVQVMADKAGLSCEAVEKNLRTHCNSFTETHNAWNDLGTQPGIARTADNVPNGFSLYPKKHIYDDDYLREINAHTHLQMRKNEGTSPGPGEITLGFIIAAALPWVLNRRKQTAKEEGPAR